MAGTEIRRGGWEFWALIALSIAGVVPIFGMPLIVGALADHWGYTAAFAGYITSARALDRFTAERADPRGVLLGFGAFDEPTIRNGVTTLARALAGREERRIEVGA